MSETTPSTTTWARFGAPEPEGAVMTRGELDRELERLHRASYGWALACCRWDRAEAEDVLQTAYLRAIEAHDGFTGDSATKTWLFAIVRNTAAERRRSRLIRGEAWARWLRGAPSDPDPDTPEQIADRDGVRRRVRDQLARLSSRQREVLHLVFYQDLTIEQAGDVLGLPVGTARKHYQRGKDRLRRLLAKEAS